MEEEKLKVNNLQFFVKLLFLFVEEKERGLDCMVSRRGGDKGVDSGHIMDINNLFF